LHLFEVDNITVLEFVLVAVKHCNHSAIICLVKLNLFDQDFLQLFPIFVQNVELRTEIVKQGSE
jgi:hypothetical protein